VVKTAGTQSLPRTLGGRVVQRMHTGVCMKPATHRQTKDVAIRVLNLNPELIDGEAIQKGTEGCSVEDIDRRLIAFLNNGLHFIMKGQGTLIVDRTKPFGPTKFIGGGWTIWRGPKDGNGLTGEEEQDARSLARTEIDFAKMLFTSCLKDGETSITGEEKLARHLAMKHVRPDAKVGQDLLEEKNQTTLEWLYKTFGITWFELPGTVLRSGYGDRYFLYLCRGGNGRWRWSCGWLGGDRNAEAPSAVLAS
jgi:hypothetical protein